MKTFKITFSIFLSLLIAAFTCLSVIQNNINYIAAIISFIVLEVFVIAYDPER